MNKMKTICWSLVVLALNTNSTYAEETQVSGKALFEGRCGGLCHQLPEPDRLNAQQWKRVLLTMQKRMQQRGMPPLTEQEVSAVLDYLMN
jgi:hypothetical protein